MFRFFLMVHLIIEINNFFSSQKNGFIALGTGMLVSVVFGFLFGLIVGATEQPWGIGDFPTDEMRGRLVNNLSFT